jgi:hypothetical protein
MRAAAAVGHDTATLAAFSVEVDGKPGLSADRFAVSHLAASLSYPAASLRLNAKRGMVSRLDAAGGVRIRVVYLP